MQEPTVETSLVLLLCLQSGNVANIAASMPRPPLFTSLLLTSCFVATQAYLELLPLSLQTVEKGKQKSYQVKMHFKALFSQDAVSFTKKSRAGNKSPPEWPLPVFNRAK